MNNLFNNILIVTGGHIHYQWAYDYINSNNFTYIIGVDRGINFLYEKKIVPDAISGDFDSADKDIFKYFADNKDILVRTFDPVKDETDTEIAIKMSIDICKTSNYDKNLITIIGATGSRIDHMMANIQLLKNAYDKNIKAYIINENNRIHIALKEEVIKKSSQYGNYISLLPFTLNVSGLTLKGFKYPLNMYSFDSGSSIGVSNEIIDDTAYISYEDGILVMFEAKD